MANHRIPISFQNPPHQFTRWEHPEIEEGDTFTLYDIEDGHEVDASIRKVILGTYVHITIDFSTLRPIEGWEPETVGKGAPLAGRIEEILAAEYGDTDGTATEVAEKIMTLLGKRTQRVVFYKPRRRDIHPYRFLENSNSYLDIPEESFEFHEIDTFQYVQRSEGHPWMFDDYKGVMKQGLFRRADIEKTPKLTAQNSGSTTSTGADGGVIYPIYYTGTTDAGSSSDGGSGDSGGGDGGGGD